MPKNYDLSTTAANAQRRPESAQDDDWIRAFLQRVRLGHIATRWGEQPFINPTTFWYDPERHTIYFHSNVVGRVRANSEHAGRVAFEASEFGRFLPSNVALEFSVQFESVVAYGEIHVLEDPAEKRRALYGLLARYFPEFQAGREFRPITDQELKRTSVYAIAVDSWSGKRNWPDRADQSDEWPALAESWFGDPAPSAA